MPIDINSDEFVSTEDNGGLPVTPPTPEVVPATEQEVKPVPTETTDDLDFVQPSEVAEQPQEGVDPDMARKVYEYQVKIGVAKKVYKDMDEQLAKVPELPRDTLDFLIGMENAAEVSYYLGRNEGEGKKVAEMKPMEAAAYLGRIADRIEGRRVGTNKPVSKAAPPPTDIKSESPKPKEGDLESMSMDALMETKFKSRY